MPVASIGSHDLVIRQVTDRGQSGVGEIPAERVYKAYRPCELYES